MLSAVKVGKLWDIKEDFAVAWRGKIEHKHIHHHSQSGGGWSALDMIVVNNVVNYDR